MTGQAGLIDGGLVYVAVADVIGAQSAVMQASPVPEPAVAVGEDPRSYARLMSAVYDATMAGHRAPARPREVIDDSWQRLMARASTRRDTAPVVETGALETLRRASGLIEVLDEISRGLESLVAEGENILVVADAQGRVLWRSGSPSVLSNADRLGFVEGAHWGEGAVGTNAIGTALASQRAVQVFSAEHFLRSHHSWTCAGAPIRDPRTGQVIGVVDVSGPAATVHPTTIALVDAVARLAESHLRARARPHAEPAAHGRRADPRAHRHARAGGRPPTAGSPRSTRCRCTTGSCCPTRLATRAGVARDAGTVRRRAAARRMAGAAGRRRR